MAVSYVRAAAARLGAIGFGGTGTLAFDATGCGVLVVCLSWADVATGQPPPYVTYAGVPAQQLRSPRGYDAANGYAAVYIVRAPAAGTHDLVVNGTQFLGMTDAAMVGLSGSDGEVGAVNTRMMAGVQSDALSLAGVVAGSRCVAFVGQRYATAPADVIASGWTKRASHADTAGGVTSSIWAFDAAASDTVVFEPDASPTYVYAHMIAVELLDAAYEGPDSNIRVTDAKVECLGGSIPGQVLTSTFDPDGAEWLLIALAAGSTGVPPLIDYEGQPLLLQPAIVATTGVGSIWWAAVPAPGSGTRTVTVTGQTGWYGATTVMWAGLDGTAGSLSVTASGAGAGVGMSFGIASAGSVRLIAFVAAEYTDIGDIAVNAEWTRHAHDADPAVPMAAGWVYSARGASGQTFEGVFSDYTNLQALVIGLRADLTGTTANAGAAALSLPAVAEAGAGTSVALPVPGGQKLGVYWESFFDIPSKPDPQPSDFHLAHIPPHIDKIFLSFGEPQCTYAGLSDNVMATTRLRFDYPASLLKDILDSVRARHPAIRFYVAVQQFPEGGVLEPYDPAGFGGMNAGHVAAWKTFCDDLGLAGIILDYEVLSQLAGFGIELSGPLVSGNTITTHLTAQYNPYPLPGGGSYSPWDPGMTGSPPEAYDPIDYDITVATAFSGSSDATLLAHAAALTAAMATAGSPDYPAMFQGRCYADTPSGIDLLRIVYHYTVGSVSVVTTVTGGASQPTPFNADNSFDYHCQTDFETKKRYCWTDAEMKRIIDLIRAGMPKPTYELWLDVFSTGLYGEYPFDRLNPPLGYNHGYDLWLARPANAATAEKLDGIHLMSYDVGEGFDPRECLQAARYYLPGLPVLIGLRVGPPDYAGIKRSIADMIDYANHVIVQEGAGAMVYALLWDLYDQRAPFTPEHPDINLCTWAVAQRFGKTDLRQRAVSRRAIPQDPVVRS